MKRSTFLALAAFLALSIGLFALISPRLLLASKGLASESANVWVREVGVLLIALGITALLVRNHEDSPTLRAFLIGNAAMQFGLLPIEIVAYREGVITQLTGIMPNSLIHLLLGASFIYYAFRMEEHSTSGG